MIIFGIVLTTILYWATSNVCRYNFAIEKKSQRIKYNYCRNRTRNYSNHEVYYFKELNCNNVNLNLGL